MACIRPPPNHKLCAHLTVIILSQSRRFPISFAIPRPCAFFCVGMSFRPLPGQRPLLLLQAGRRRSGVRPQVCRVFFFLLVFKDYSRFPQFLESPIHIFSSCDFPFRSAPHQFSTHHPHIISRIKSEGHQRTRKPCLNLRFAIALSTPRPPNHTHTPV